MSRVSYAKAHLFEEEDKEEQQRREQLEDFLRSQSFDPDRLPE